MFGPVLVAFGLVILVIGTILSFRAHREVDWPTVEGVVSRIGIGPSMRYYVPKIEYTYSVGQNLYRGTRLQSLAVHTNWRESAQRKADQYPVGKNVVVFVNPTDPFDAVLEPGGDRRFLILIVVCSLMLIWVGAQIWLRK
jgi:hypothetical protein